MAGEKLDVEVRISEEQLKAISELQITVNRERWTVMWPEK